MKKFILYACLAVPLITQAHPHAFVDMQNKILVQENKLVGFSMRWLLDEASSSAVLYDIKQTKGDPIALQALTDEVMNNIVNEHYFSYLFNKEGDKIKYQKQIKNPSMKVVGQRVAYSFDFLLSQPQSLNGQVFYLQTYDPTYYVAMHYPEKIKNAVNFDELPANCHGDVLAPHIDEKIQSYASSLDKSQKDEDNSLGVMFAQKVKIQCE